MMDLSISAQEEYRRSYPHIPSELALSLNMAKKLTSEDPAKCPRLNDFADVLEKLA